MEEERENYKVVDYGYGGEEVPSWDELNRPNKLHLKKKLCCYVGN